MREGKRRKTGDRGQEIEMRQREEGDRMRVVNREVGEVEMRREGRKRTLKGNEVIQRRPVGWEK